MVELINGKQEVVEDKKFLAMLEDRNKAVSKWFKYDKPLDVKCMMHSSFGSVKSALFYVKDDLGVFSGFNVGEDFIHCVYPHTVETIFEDLDKEMLVLIDYALVKYYVSKKYFPTEQEMKRYDDFVMEALAKVSSGKIKKDMLKMDFKDFEEDARIKKDVELLMVFFVIMDVEGLDKIYDLLDNIMEDKKIKKTLLNYYKKSVAEIILPYKKEAEEAHRALLNRFKHNRKPGNFQRKRPQNQGGNNNSQDNNQNSNGPQKRFVSKRNYNPNRKFDNNRSSQDGDKKRTFNKNKKPVDKDKPVMDKKPHSKPKINMG